MIKASIRDFETGRRTLVIFGLSDLNLQKLKEGLPILVKGAELNLDHDVLILWGKTEQAIALELAKMFPDCPFPS